MRYPLLFAITLLSSASIFSFTPRNNTLFNTNLDSLESKKIKADSPTVAITNSGYAKEILRKYINAIGTEDLLRSVNDRIIDVKGWVQGVETEIMFYQKVPNKLYQKTIAGDVMQEIIFDGSKGIKKIGEIVQEITGDELIKLSYDAIMNLILEPELYDVELKYDGLEKLGERDAYKIILVLPNQTQWYQYYDMETGFKVRESKEIATPRANFMQITEYDDYRTVDGISYPFKIKQYLGNQTLDFLVESIRVNTGISDELFLIE